MAMRSKLRLLSPAVREELHAIIRGNVYGNVDETRAWLAEKGLVFSRSGIHRYISRLRKADATAGVVEARMASREAPKRRRAGAQTRTRRMILERLGALELKRQSLIHELGLIDGQALHDSEPAAE